MACPSLCMKSATECKVKLIIFNIILAKGPTTPSFCSLLSINSFKNESNTQHAYQMYKTASCSKRDREHSEQEKNHKKVVFSECALTQSLDLKSMAQKRIPRVL